MGCWGRARESWRPKDSRGARGSVRGCRDREQGEGSEGEGQRQREREEGED